MLVSANLCPGNTTRRANAPEAVRASRRSCRKAGQVQSGESQFSNAACRRNTAARDGALFDTTGADDGNAKSRLRRAWRRNVNFLDWAQRQAGRRSWVDRHAPRQSLHCGADVRSRGTHFFEGGARRPGGGQLEPLLDQHSLNCITPVMLPPGRLTLATSPSLTASPPIENTIELQIAGSGVSKPGAARRSRRFAERLRLDCCHQHRRRPSGGARAKPARRPVPTWSSSLISCEREARLQLAAHHTDCSRAQNDSQLKRP